MARFRTLGRPVCCLVCGVDSGPIRTFLLLFIGALVGASLFGALWAFFSGRLKDDEGLERFVLDVEGRENERAD